MSQETWKIRFLVVTNILIVSRFLVGIAKSSN
jgi:hypothetical protein